MPDLLELQDLYSESLAREILEKTLACGIIWSQVTANQFHATSVDANNVSWDFYITQTPVGNTAAKWTMDIKKSSVAYVSISDGPLPITGRDSTVKTLYETVELIVLQLDAKLKETLQFVQNITDCRTS